MTLPRNKDDGFRKSSTHPTASARAHEIRDVSLSPSSGGAEICTAPPLALNAVYPPTRHLSVKVRLFIDFLVERFGHEDEA
ncbi:DNA-binding transcriptional LysR family regulator [Bradyrhizobium sp. GM24.11]